jgi:hypothetical protein
VLRKDDFVCTDLTFAEFNEDVGVQGVVEEWSGEAIYRCHDEILRSGMCSRLWDSALEVEYVSFQVKSIDERMGE